MSGLWHGIDDVGRKILTLVRIGCGSLNVGDSDGYLGRDEVEGEQGEIVRLRGCEILFNETILATILEYH